MVSSLNHKTCAQALGKQVISGQNGRLVKSNLGGFDCRRGPESVFEQTAEYGRHVNLEASAKQIVT